MSGGLDILNLKQEDVTKMLSATTHIGSENVNFQMEQYVYKRRADGVHIINLRRTWEKLLLAARAIACVEPHGEVFVISSKPYGQRAVLKYATHTGATPIAGRYTPGAFTNQIQTAFREPRLLVVTDPHNDHQPITEASYVNIPVIAFCNTDSPLRYVDIVIPCNNKAVHSIGLMWWLLAREVTRFRGRESSWNVVVDLFFYRDPDEAEKEEAVTKEPVAVPKAVEPAEYTPASESWAEEPISGTPKQWADEGGAPSTTAVISEEWSAQADNNTAAANEWGAPTGPSSWS